MTAKQTHLRFLWFALFVAFSFFAGGRWPLWPAAWITPIFALRFYRHSEKGWHAFLLMWFATAALSTTTWHNATALHQLSPLAEPIMFLLISPLSVIPLALDRFYYRHWAKATTHPIWLTLIYPVSLAAIDYVSSSDSPFGSFGAAGYTQHRFLPLIQLTAVIGLWGIPFLIGWFATTINHIWETQSWPQSKKLISIYGTTLLLVLALGWGRLATAPPIASEQVVLVGGFSLTEESFRHNLSLANSGQDDAFRAAASTLNTAQLAQIRSMAHPGVKIITLQEGAIMGYEPEVSEFMVAAQQLAQEKSLYLILPTVTLFSENDRPFENVVYIVDPQGEIVLEHYKYGGTQFEGSLAGNKVLQTVDTPYGKLSAVICWDADFPDVMRQAGEQEVDLLFIPSNDWAEVQDIHADMATFRAIENGVPIFRQTGSGVSLVTDSYGRVINRIDSFTTQNGLWSAEQIVVTPIGSVNTLYPELGDSWGILMLLGFGIILLLRIWLSRLKDPNRFNRKPKHRSY